MFDRVYAPLLVQGRTVRRDVHDPVFAPDIPIQFSFSDDSLDLRRAMHDYTNGYWLEGACAGDFADPEFVKRSDLATIRHIILGEQELEQGYRQRGVMGTWCASKRGLYLERFSEGQVAAYQGALNNLPIVRADIGWDEVTSFRQDPVSVRKYRDLRLWLADGLKSSSEQHATDLIAQRIEDYRWAIKKHGLQTVTGALTNLWDWKQSITLAASVGAAATIGSAAIAALVAGLSITSGVGAFFAQRKLSKLDVEHGPGREVAVLVDIQDRFGDS